MQATRGFAVRVRSRGRLVGLCTALAAIIAAFVVPPVSSAMPPPPVNELPPVPEIAVAAGTVLQFPVILRDDDKDPAEVTVSMTLPEGWALKNPLPHYKLSPGDIFPIEIELTSRASISPRLVFTSARRPMSSGPSSPTIAPAEVDAPPK